MQKENAKNKKMVEDDEEYEQERERRCVDIYKKMKGFLVGVFVFEE